MSVVRVSPTTRDAVVRLLGELSPGGMSSEALARIGRLRPAVVEATLAQLEAARTAYSLYGRDTGHPANLNMGDCFSYALAKTRNLPLLFKGEDFIHTDVRSALKPA